MVDILVDKKPPYDINIELPTLESFYARLDYGPQPVALAHNNETVKIAFEHDVGQKWYTMSRKDSDNFFSEVYSEGSFGRIRLFVFLSRHSFG